MSLMSRRRLNFGPSESTRRSANSVDSLSTGAVSGPCGEAIITLLSNSSDMATPHSNTAQLDSEHTASKCRRRPVNGATVTQVPRNPHSTATIRAVQRRPAFPVHALSSCCACRILGQRGFRRPSRSPDQADCSLAAGAGTDAVARSLHKSWREQLKQPVVVENRVGASGAIGTQAVALAPADGYTLLFVARHSPPLPRLRRSPRTRDDPVKQFAPVALIAAGPLVWIANAQAPFGSMREMIAYAWANPGKLAYGSAGAGGVNHLARVVQEQNGTDIPHCHTRHRAGNDRFVGRPIMTLTGTIPAVLLTFKSGKARALAVTGDKALAAAARHTDDEGNGRQRHRGLQLL